MIYKKTELGQIALHDRSVQLTPRQRSAFILFNGHRDDAEVLVTTSGLGVTPDDVNHLVLLGLLAPDTPAPETQAFDTTLPSSAVLENPLNSSPTANAQARYLKAYPIATRLTAELGLRGFRLNLAIETAANLDKLKELAPKIQDAVGPEKFLELKNALYE